MTSGTMPLKFKLSKMAVTMFPLISRISNLKLDSVQCGFKNVYNYNYEFMIL